MSISSKRYAYGFALALAAGALAGVPVVATTAIANVNDPIPVDGDAVVGASVLAGAVGAVLAVPMYGIITLVVSQSERRNWLGSATWKATTVALCAVLAVGGWVLLATLGLHPGESSLALGAGATGLMGVVLGLTLIKVFS